MTSFLYVFIGGGLGSMCRYGLTLLFNKMDNGFPFPTILANILSCIILGFLLASLIDHEIDSKTRILWMTGFCGGFSTFSTFSAEKFELIQNGQFGLALVYLAMSILVCLSSIYIGWKIASIL